MKINDLKIKSINRGTVVEVWTECYSTDDIDNLIAWLQLAKGHADTLIELANQP